jgi:very-short-patch-repair endonuclease
MNLEEHHPPTPSSEEEGEPVARNLKAPSSSEEGVGGGGHTRKVLLERAAAMRHIPTEPERRMWMELRDSRFFGHKFRRQAVMGQRIVDFFCPAKGLVVEIDGETHDPELDLRRDATLRRTFGFRVLRFTNEEVMRNLEGVLRALQIALESQPARWLNGKRHHHPTGSGLDCPRQSKSSPGDWTTRRPSEEKGE